MASVVSLGSALFMQPAEGDSDITYSGIKLRGLFTALLDDEGIIGSASLLVHPRSAGANFTVEVDPGNAAIDGDDIADQNRYICGNGSVISLDVPAAPSSGTLTHRVVARIRDKLHNASYTTYDWALEILADDGSGVPAVPPSAIPLARVTVSSTTSAITSDEITDDRALARQHGASKHSLNGVDPGPHATELIEQISLSSNDVPIVFTNIPQHYTNLRIELAWRIQTAGTTESAWLRFNDDNTDSYDSGWIGSKITETDLSAVHNGSNVMYFGRCGDMNSSATLIINGYSKSDIFKSVHSYGTAMSSTSANGFEIVRGGGRWRSNNPITTITINKNGTDPYQSGTVVTLYGER